MKPSGVLQLPSGGRSRRLQALNISTRPISGYGSPTATSPGRKQEDGNLAGREAERSRKGTARNLRVKRAGLPGTGEGGRGVGAGGACPDTPSPSCPESCRCLHWSSRGTWKRRGGEEGGVSLSSYFWLTPPTRRGWAKGGGGGRGGGLRRNRRSWEVSREMGQAREPPRTQARGSLRPPFPNLNPLPHHPFSLFLSGEGGSWSPALAAPLRPSCSSQN